MSSGCRLVVFLGRGRQANETASQLGSGGRARARRCYCTGGDRERPWGNSSGDKQYSRLRTAMPAAGVRPSLGTCRPAPIRRNTSSPSK